MVVACEMIVVRWLGLLACNVARSIWSNPCEAIKTQRRPRLYPNTLSVYVDLAHVRLTMFPFQSGAN